MPKIFYDRSKFIEKSKKN